MAKRANPDQKIDPVRSGLAAAVAAPPPKRRPLTQPEQTPKPATPARPAAEKPRTRTAPKPAKPAAKPKAMTKNRKFMVTPEEGDEMDITLGVISAAFKSKVTYSQTSRALWVILANAEDALKAAGRKAPKLTPPSTGDALGMAEYEEAVTEFLIEALRRV